MSLDLDAIRARYDRAYEELGGICDGTRKWTMRVPADQERDSDLVISVSLDDVPTLLAEVERLRAELDGARGPAAREYYDAGEAADVIAQRAEMARSAGDDGPEATS